MIAREVTDLPEPDSPTMPSVLPASRSKETPRTASTRPASEAKLTREIADREDGGYGCAHARPPAAEVGSRASRRPSAMRAIDTVSSVSAAAGK